MPSAEKTIYIVKYNPIEWAAAEAAVAADPERNIVNRHTLTAGVGPAEHPNVYPMTAGDLHAAMGWDPPDDPEWVVWIAGGGFLRGDLAPSDELFEVTCECR